MFYETRSNILKTKSRKLFRLGKDPIPIEDLVVRSTEKILAPANVGAFSFLVPPTHCSPLPLILPDEKPNDFGV